VFVSKRFNLVFEANATFQHTVNWKDPSGAPIDLTGFRIRLQVRQSPSSASTLLDFDSEDLAEGQSISELGESGSFTITLTPDFTGALDFQAAEYDLTATSPGGIVYRLHEGKATVSPGVTR
jgi:hypothetical protein